MTRTAEQAAKDQRDARLKAIGAAELMEKWAKEADAYNLPPGCKEAYLRAAARLRKEGGE